MHQNQPLFSREALVAAMQDGYTPEWLHFWGHTPEKDGSIGKACLSQWWEGHPFSHDGIEYRTTEHFMMAGKARLFGDQESVEKILAANHPGEAKKLGRLVRGFEQARWAGVCFDLVATGNAAKFQHPALRSFLLGTGDRVLVEASPHDAIWGIGLSASDAAASVPMEWKGQNLLGFALMKVRSALQA